LDRLHILQRQYSIIKALGVDCAILNVEKLKEKLPIIDPHEVWVLNKFIKYNLFDCAYLRGGLWIPNDFMIDPELK
jgi:hypothetical protein